MPPKTYISSSGDLASPPLSKTVYDAVTNYATIVYLFFDTLITPVLTPNANVLDSQQAANGAPRRGTGERLGGGGSAGNGAAGGRPSGGFMTMTDLGGSGTVDACRSGCS